MRQIRYQVAVSLDGFIAGPHGEYDWIPGDPDIDVHLGEMLEQFDTLLMGRKTFETTLEAGDTSFADGKTMVVVSSTLAQSDHPEVVIIGDDWENRVRSIRQESGKDIWLFGGGQLFRGLLSVNLVDTVELAVVPILLGDGVPVMPPPYTAERLAFKQQRVFDKSGIVLLEYAVADE